MPGTAPTRVAALLTCFNRRDLTVRAIGSLLASVPEDVDLEVVMVDDGSSDGTADAVLAKFPKVHIVQGSGQLYWSGGMSLAQRAAMTDPPDFLLWLNDDVELDDDALARVLATSRDLEDKAMVVGAVADSKGNVTYSGFRRPGRRPLRLVEVEPGSVPISIDTMNGNFVLIPRSVAEAIGPIDDKFTHRFGDIDYGYRAGSAGIPVMLAPGTVGRCEANDVPAPHLATGLTLRKRLQLQAGPIYLPFKDQLRFSRRHAGWLWPAAAISPYVGTVSWHLRQRAVSRG